MVGCLFVCLFVLELGLDVSHGAALSSLCLTIVTEFAEFTEVTSSICATKERLRSLDHGDWLNDEQKVGIYVTQLQDRTMVRQKESKCPRLSISFFDENS